MNWIHGNLSNTLLTKALEKNGTRFEEALQCKQLFKSVLFFVYITTEIDVLVYEF